MTILPIFRPRARIRERSPRAVGLASRTDRAEALSSLDEARVRGTVLRELWVTLLLGEAETSGSAGPRSTSGSAGVDFFDAEVFAAEMFRTRFVNLGALSWSSSSSTSTTFFTTAG